MTAQDKKDIAKLIVDEINKNQPKISCPHGIDAETAQGLKDFVNLANTSKRAAMRAFVTFIVAGTLSALGYAFWIRIEEIVSKITGK